MILCSIVIGRVTCRLEGVTERFDKDAIVSGILRQLSDREYQMDGFESNLRLLSLGLNYVRRSNGIVLYFHCRSEEELQALRAKFNNGSLKQKAEEDVSELTTLPKDQVKLTMEWADHDYKRCELYFTLVPSTTVSQCLCLAILHLILLNHLFRLIHWSQDLRD